MKTIGYKSYIFLMLSLLVFLENNGIAQINQSVSYFKYLGFKDGLSENDVKEFATDSTNGYWFRTEKSIVFYNGHDFINFRSKNSLFTIKNEHISAFVIKNQKVYVFGNKGIERIDCRSKATENLLSDTIGLQIKNGFVSSKGKIIFISAKGIIYQKLKSEIREIGKIKYVTHSTIVETKEEDLIVSNDFDEMLVFNSALQIKKKILLEPQVTLSNNAIYAYPKTGTIVFLNGRAYEYNSIRNELILSQKNIPFDRYFFAAENHYYIIKDFNQIRQYDWQTNAFVNLNIDLGLNYYINQLSVDQSGTLVLCTNQGIILYKEPNPFFKILPAATKNDSYDPNTRRSLIEMPDGKVIQICYRSIDIYDPRTGLNKRFFSKNLTGYSAILEQNTLWLGTDGSGLFKLNMNTGDALRIRSNTSSSTNNMHVTCMSVLNDSILLLGTSISDARLILFNKRRQTYVNAYIKDFSGGYIKEKVTAIVDGSNGSKWICTNQGLVYVSRDMGLKQLINYKHINTNIVNHVIPVSDTLLWIATDDGIVIYNTLLDKITQQVNKENGLADNKVVSLLLDQYNTVWASTFAGLSRVDIKTYLIDNYYIQDGLIDNEYNYSSYLKTSTGNLYFGGLNGFVKIVPFNRKNVIGYKPKFSIDYAVFRNNGGSELQTGKYAYNLHFKDDRLTLAFSLKEPISSEFTDYKYRIVGLQSDWNSLGSQNKLDIHFLPTGNYTIQIMAEDGRVKRNQYIIEIPLRVFKYWYQSSLFYFVISIIVVFSLALFFYQRIIHARRLVELRTNLANDIHDEIGTMLTKAVIKLNMFKQKTSSSYPEISSIELLLREAIQSFRNVLWSLNQEKQKTEDFVGRINLLLEEIFGETHFSYLVTNLSSNIYFNQSIEVKRNLLLIIKELAHNCLKHSNGNLFEIVIRNNQKSWELLVVDNGKNISEIKSDGGLGISSIMNRAAKINAKIHYENQIHGLFITITI